MKREPKCSVMSLAVLVCDRLCAHGGNAVGSV